MIEEASDMPSKAKKACSSKEVEGDVAINVYVDGFLHQGSWYVDSGKRSEGARTIIHKNAATKSLPFGYEEVIMILENFCNKNRLNEFNSETSFIGEVSIGSTYEVPLPNHMKKTKPMQVVKKLNDTFYIDSGDSLNICIILDPDHGVESSSAAVGGSKFTTSKLLEFSRLTLIRQLTVDIRNKEVSYLKGYQFDRSLKTYDEKIQEVQHLITASMNFLENSSITSVAGGVAR